MSVDYVLMTLIFSLNGCLLGAGYWFLKIGRAASIRAEQLNEKWDGHLAKVNELHNSTVTMHKKIAEWMTIQEMRQGFAKK